MKTEAHDGVEHQVRLNTTSWCGETLAQNEEILLGGTKKHCDTTTLEGKIEHIRMCAKKIAKLTDRLD